MSPLLIQTVLSCSLVSPQVSVNDKGKSFVEYDTNVSINIPPKTTIAYSVIELEVAHTGHYGIDCSACFAKAEFYHSVVSHWKFCTNYCFCLKKQINF